LDAWLTVRKSAHDFFIHGAYLAMVYRLKQTGILSESNLADIVKAEGYKLDEIDSLDYVRAFLHTDEAALKKFFAIEGQTLPRMLTRALKAIGGVSDA